MKIKSFKIPVGTWLSDNLAEYQINDCLGRGWEAECYSCVEGFSDGSRVIKVFESSELEEKLFCQYAFKLEKLNQANVPGVIRFYHAGYWKKFDSWFLILEKVNGVDLKVYKKRLSVFQALKVVRQLFFTISKAHQICVCFGDLHEENILINKLDFSTTIIDIAMEIDEYSIENVNEDITAVCQLLYYLCDNVPPELQKIVPIENIQNCSASKILESLNNLF